MTELFRGRVPLTVPFFALLHALFLVIEYNHPIRHHFSTEYQVDQLRLNVRPQVIANAEKVNC